MNAEERKQFRKNVIASFSKEQINQIKNNTVESEDGHNESDRTDEGKDLH